MSQTNLNILSDICRGDITQLKILKANDPSFHWSTVFFPKTKETSLHLAAQYGYTEIIKYLLNEFYYKTVDVRNIDNKTPLHDAAQFGKYDCVQLLVDSGADVNALKRSDWTPLMLACTKSGNCYEAIVQCFLEKGSLLNFKNKDGWTSLHLAARNPNPSILKTLLDNSKVDVTALTKNRRNALHISALHGILKNVELLVSRLDPNSYDSSGNTPLHEAVLSGKLEVIDYLVAKGADPTICNSIGASPLHLAAGQDLDYVIEHLVLKYKCDTNKTDVNGYTALHWAFRKSNDNAVNRLVKLGANLEILDNCGRLAHDYMIEKIT